MSNSAEMNLKERCVKEQDELVYFWYNGYEEKLFGKKIDPEFNISYYQLDKDFLKENIDVMQDMSMNNLVYLLTSNNAEVKNAARVQIMEKFRNGEHIFQGENAFYPMDIGNWHIEANPWATVYSELGKENIEEMRQKILSGLDELKDKDSKAYDIIFQAPKLCNVDNFLSVYEQGTFTPEKLELLEKLVSQNPNILNVINFRIFEDDIFDMGEDFISRIAKYPNFSNKFIKIYKNNPELFETVKKGFNDLEQNARLPEALGVEEATISYITMNCHKIDNADFSQLANCAIRWRELGSNVKVDYTENYEEEFEKACDEEFNGRRAKSDIEYKKNILLSKYFGMTSFTAKNFHKSYIKNANQLNLQDEELKQYLSEIDRILQTTDMQEIEELYNSMTRKVTPLERMHYEDSLREEYSKSYVEELQNTDSQLTEKSDVQYIEFENKKIKQLKLNGDFSLLVHSTDSGFKGAKQLKDGSFLKTWQQTDVPDTHLSSCCYMNQDFLGHVPANENGVLMAFTKSKTDEINLMGPTDINSHIRNYNFASGSSMYMTAENLPNYARRVYSEIPIPKRDPDYHLIFDDSPEQILQNTYKAASEFDVPVIFIDKKEIEKQQLENLDNLVQEFSDSKDLNVLAKLVSTYETNTAGWLLNRDPSEKDESLTQDINNERFRGDFEQRKNAINMAIGNYIENARKQGDCTQDMQQIISIMQAEIGKYHMVEDKNTPLSKTTMNFDAQSIIDKVTSIMPEIAMQDKGKSSDASMQTVDLKSVAERSIPDVTIRNVNLANDKLKSMEESTNEKLYSDM